MAGRRLRRGVPLSPVARATLVLALVALSTRVSDAQTQHTRRELPAHAQQQQQQQHWGDANSRPAVRVGRSDDERGPSAGSVGGEPRVHRKNTRDGEGRDRLLGGVGGAASFTSTRVSATQVHAPRPGVWGNPPRKSTEVTERPASERRPNAAGQEGFSGFENAAATTSGRKADKRQFKYENTFAAQLEKALNREFSEEDDATDAADADAGGHRESPRAGDAGRANVDIIGRHHRDRGVSGRSFNRTAGLEGAHLEQVARIRAGGAGGGGSVTADDPRPLRPISVGGTDGAGRLDGRDPSPSSGNITSSLLGENGNATSSRGGSASLASLGDVRAASLAAQRLADASEPRRAERLAVAEAFLHRVGATAAAVDRAVTGKGAGRFGDPELDVARLVDAGANEFVISNPKSGATELQQDLRLIGDLVVSLVAAAVGTSACALLFGMPPSVGYLLAGSCVGPGGLNLVKEMVQVATLAQLGVILTLFTRGAELAAAANGARGWGGGVLVWANSPKPRGHAGRHAFNGGAARGSRENDGGAGWRRAAASGAAGAGALAAFSALLAPSLGATPAVGAVTGALLFFSSTETIRWGMTRPGDHDPPRASRAPDVPVGAQNAIRGPPAHGRMGAVGATVSRAIARRLALQDWSLGPMFALLPAMKAATSARTAAIGLMLNAARAVVFLAAAWVVWTCSLKVFLLLVGPGRGGRGGTPGGAELRDLGLVVLCLAAAATSAHVGLGMEIGSFAAGVAVGGSGGESGSDTSIGAIAPLRALFNALQLTSAGMLFSPRYCWRHLPALTTGLAGVVGVKWAAGTFAALRSPKMAPASALAVGAATAQVGELAIALLNRAHVLGVVSRKYYKPLLSVAVMSVVGTPAINFRLLPWVLRVTLSLPFGRWLVSCLGSGGVVKGHGDRDSGSEGEEEPEGVGEEERWEPGGTLVVVGKELEHRRVPHTASWVSDV